MTHLGLMMLFAGLTSIVFAVIARETPAEQGRAALRMFAAFLAVAFIMGWLMYVVPL